MEARTEGDGGGEARTEADGGGGLAVEAAPAREAEAGAPALADHQINDQASFDAATSAERGESPDHAVAGLYAYKYLDGLIDLARCVGRDFFARPHLYTTLGDFELASQLARLDARSGTDERYLSREQREAIYAPLFGGGQDAQSDFVKLRDAMLEAAAAFSEWSQATGIPMLYERVRTVHRPFKEYLTGLAGATVAWSRRSALPALAERAAYPILRDKGVIAVFGLTQVPPAASPYREDSNGDKVVEEIGRRLNATASAAWTRQSFSATQRVALRGAEALATVLDFDEVTGTTKDLDRLITRCYTWYAAMLDLKAPGMVVGARDGHRP